MQGAGDVPGPSLPADGRHRARLSLPVRLLTQRAPTAKGGCLWLRCRYRAGRREPANWPAAASSQQGLPCAGESKPTAQYGTAGDPHLYRRRYPARPTLRHRYADQQDVGLRLADQPAHGRLCGLIMAYRRWCALTGSLARSPPLIVLSTLTIAAMFQPLRRWRQALID
jgi:hypothetical protein